MDQEGLYLPLMHQHVCPDCFKAWTCRFVKCAALQGRACQLCYHVEAVRIVRAIVLREGYFVEPGEIDDVELAAGRA
jgi:hypothetical protein